MEWAEPIAYGKLHLKPHELESITLMEFEAMVKGLKAAEASRRQETAYWLSWIINCFTKKPVKQETLLKPFQEEKTSEEKAGEAMDFFRQFKKQQQEAKKWQQ